MEPTIVKRPWYLTTILILTILYYLLGIAGAVGLLLVSSAAAQLAPGGISIPSWYLAGTIILLVVGIVGTIMVFKWKKASIYLLGGTAILSLVLDYSAAAQAQTIFGVILTLLPPVLIYLSMRPVWSSFK